MNDNRYNGWTNYETWNVNLWLANDGSQYVDELAQQCFDDCDGDKDDAARALADQLQSEHEENMPEAIGCYADLLSASLREVNWYEIAAHYIDELEPIEVESDDENEVTP